MNKLILLKGTSGVGKSSVANAFVSSKPDNCVHLDWDIVYPKDQLIILARQYLKLGKDVVISEWFYSKYRNIEYIIYNLPEINIVFIELLASLETCLIRNKCKNNIVSEISIKEHYYLSKNDKDMFQWHKIDTNNKDTSIIVKEIEKIVEESLK